jgi:hypothetical protein
MSRYRFVKLQAITKQESEELLRLKEEFNVHASNLNMLWPSLSEEERKIWYDKIDSLEQLIKHYDK